MSHAATKEATSEGWGERWRALYVLRGSQRDAATLAAELCIEQTVEFPADLVTDEWIRGHVFGRVEDLRAIGADRFVATLSFATQTVAGELTQLLNVLFGNCSLKPGVRLVDVQFGRDIRATFRGPRFGVAGLRLLLGAPTRPLLCTALKPMGLDSARLAELAGAFALGGIDLIKDDHGLANQPFAEFDERVARCAEAVAHASASTGRPCLYAPNVSAPIDRLHERAHHAKECGAGALLVAPGLVGFDAMRALAEDETLSLPVLCHPAMLGSFLLGPDHGIDHGALLGKIARLAGADATIFPTFGGRFSFTPKECRAVVRACRTALGSLAPIVPVPAGGISLESVPELLRFYGSDVALLIGGDLHRHGDLVAACAELRSLVDEAAAS